MAGDSKKHGERAYTPQEVAEREQVSEPTIRRMCQNGEIPAYKVRRRWRILPNYRDYLQDNGDEK